MKFFDRLGIWLRGAPPSVHEQLRRRMRSVARGAVASLGADTAARIVGVVRADAALIAPLSGQPCVADHLAFDGGEESGMSCRLRFWRVPRPPCTLALPCSVGCTSRTSSSSAT